MKNKLKILCAKINIEALAVVVMLLSMFNVLNGGAAKFQANNKPAYSHKNSIEEFSDNDTQNIGEKLEEYKKLENKNDLQFVSPTNKLYSTQTNPESQGASLEEQTVDESYAIPTVSVPTPTQIVFCQRQHLCPQIHPHQPCKQQTSKFGCELGLIRLMVVNQLPVEM